MENNIFADISLDNPEYRYEQKGFCSIINQLIDIADFHFNKYNNHNFFVRNKDVEELFDLNNLDGADKYDAGSEFLNKYFAGEYDNSFNEHVVANRNHLLKKNIIFNTLMKIKKQYLLEFEEKYKDLKIDENTIAVHLRGTDKNSEIPDFSIEKVFKMIDVQRLNSEKIFVSTDDKRYLDLMINEYGLENILYDSSMLISHTGNAVHKSFADQKFRVNKESLMSAYLLSKCKRFLYCFSNLSYIALIMGVNDFEFIQNINTGVDDKK
jgi:hypothetical protein